MKTKKYIALCLLALTAVVYTRCAEEFVSPAPITGSTIVDVARTDTTLQIFDAALTKTGIGISLGNINSGLHTVFAPTDSAFRAYFQPLIGGGPGDATIIAYVNTLSSTSNPTLAAFTTRLQYHIVSSEAMSDQLTNSKVFTTINTARLSLSNNGSNIFINANVSPASLSSNGSKVKVKDKDAANGVIHTVSKFMNPISTANFYVGTTGLGITVNYSTAPPTVTNSVSGAGPNPNWELFSKSIIKTGMAPVLRPNVSASFLPDYSIYLPVDAAMVTYLGTLSGGTVTDEATAKTFIDGLAANDPKLATLTDIVKYHTVSGRVLTTDLVVNQNVTTLLTGKTFKVISSSVLQDFKAANSNITGANTLLTNAGIVHQIDKVMEPN